MRHDIEKPGALQLFILSCQRELVRRAEQRTAAKAGGLPNPRSGPRRGQSGSDYSGFPEALWRDGS